MSGLPPQAITQAKQAAAQPDPKEIRLRVGIWRGHTLGELAASADGRAYLRSLLPRPRAAVSDDLKGYIAAVLGLEG